MKNSKGKKTKKAIQEKEPFVENYEMKKSFYFGFRERVITLLFLILLLFGLGCFLVFNYVGLKKGDTVKYSEVSDLSYKVCLLDNDVYDTQCLDSDKTYNSLLVDKINANFLYNVDFSEDIDYQLYYHVVLYSKIYDGDNKDRILYEDKELLVDKTLINRMEKKINFKTDVEIDFKKYNDFVNKYKSKYSSDSKASMEVVLYLDEFDEERSISTINIPLGEKNFEIDYTTTSNKNRTVQLENDVIDTEADLNLFLGSFLIVISLLLDLRLVRLVKTTFSKKSKYELELNRILREYDKYIVNATDGYIIDPEKNIIKVEKFEELIDASMIIIKPILYYKINNIKSEFIVDDVDKTYKYTLKEVDLED